MAKYSIQEAIHIALRLHQGGRTGEAESIYRQVLEREPNHCDALHLLGALASQTNRLEMAVELLTRAVSLQPDFPAAQNNLGGAFHRLGRWDQAIVAYHAALKSKPDYAEAHNNLGNALQDIGQLDEAIASYRVALQFRPDNPEFLSNLGNALKNKKHFEQAIDCHRKALTIRPDYAQGHYNLAVALHDAGRLEDSIACYEKLVQMHPEYTAAHCNLGIALAEVGQTERAIEHYQRAIALENDLPEAHLNCAQALLLRGNFAQGWREYEWRWKCRDFPSPRRDFPQPLWDGSNLAGRTILLHAEQGLGDTIQFVRYVRMVAGRGGKVIFQCQPELLRLFNEFPGVDHLIHLGESPPEFDLHCPLMSLPMIFGTTQETIPKDIPYLAPDPSEALSWKQSLSRFGSKPKVGLVWAGGTIHKNDSIRSIHPSILLPLAEVSEVTFVSLQKGDAAAHPPAIPLVDIAANLNDFADTAALIANLDLVVSVDTAAAHLAGAMGKPVWLLLPFTPDWRWLLDRLDSPWYPTMRLFRQKARGDWQTVIQELVQALHKRFA